MANTIQKHTSYIRCRSAASRDEIATAIENKENDKHKSNHEECGQESR